MARINLTTPSPVKPASPCPQLVMTTQFPNLPLRLPRSSGNFFRQMIAVFVAFPMLLASGYSAEAPVERFPGINPEPMQRPYRLETLDREGIPSVLAGVKNREQWEAKKKEIMASWLDYLGGIPQRPHVEYKVVSETQMVDHIRQKITYNTVDGDTITAYLLIPEKAYSDHRSGKKSKRFAAILALHPTHQLGKDNISTLEGRRNRQYALELVQRGYVVLAPDTMTAGERIFPGYRDFDTTEFYRRYPKWTSAGKNLTDHLQAMDLLVDHPLVDARRIGAIGHSFGAYNAFFLASMDTRVAAIVSSCGVCPFSSTGSERIKAHWAKRNYTHFPRYSDDLEKGIVPFEFNEIMALSAPRPQFYYAAQSDHIFPHWEAVGRCLFDVSHLYTLLGAEENFVSYMGNGDHDFPPAIRAAAYTFLDEHLRIGTPEEPAGQ